MMKYPIGMQSFDQIVEGGFVYVDKTALVHRLATTGKIYFLSRPRRFGKSLLLSTLKNYFLGRRELFRGLAVEKLEERWEPHPVLHIDFNGTNFTRDGALEQALGTYLADREDEYGCRPVSTDPGERLVRLLAHIHRQSGRHCVVLVDEYDKPLLDVLDTGLPTARAEGLRLLEESNRATLRSFYSAFKAADEHLRFVMLTGVTKFAQVSVFSGFNQLADISMDARYEALCGITQEELDTCFAEPVRTMADEAGCSVDEMKAQLKRRYDGYHFSRRMTDVYNPFSLLNAFARQEPGDYWFQSGTPSYLIRLLNHSHENLDELTGRYYDPQEFIDYKATVEKPLPMIYQSGYLTIKNFNSRRGTFLLDFPNDEVKKGFVALLAAEYLKPQGESMNSWILNVVDALEGGRPDELCRLFTTFLAETPYSMRRNNDERERERYFHYTLYLIFRLVSVYTVYTERQLSGGRADCVVETPRFVYVFEFKLDGSAAEALRQIDERGYALPYAGGGRAVFRIGASFSSTTGTIAEWETRREG